MDYSKLKKFYTDQIQNNFVPYWTKFIDHEYGGILNCISNDGENLLSRDKFTWSQGRWLWVLATIHEMNKKNQSFPSIDNSTLLLSMEKTYNFIKYKSIYGNSICCFVLTQDGDKKKDEKTGRYDASIYADCFALIGMSKYIMTTNKLEEVYFADKLASSIIDRLNKNDYLTEPYPIPNGYKIHGIPMIMVNTIQEYAEMKEYFNQECKVYIDYARAQVNFILDDLYDKEYDLIHEHISTEENKTRRLIDRHINPGHTLEDAWFWIEHLEKYGNIEDRIDQISRIVKSTFHLGWDNEYGGLLRFVDYLGCAPKGELIHTPYEDLVISSWDMKLWWPHSELLYLFPLLYSLTNDKEFESLYEQSFDYALSTFPSPNKKEWIQIRKRNGVPEDRVIALPVKDPFHIMRDFLKVISLSERLEND